MNAVMKPAEDGELIYLSPSDIEVADGFNPRTYFDPDKMKELEESIRNEGVQQNLIVRPHPDAPGRYILIAGERRLRAARNVGVTDIPVLVRHVNERQALAIAALENDKRDNIGPAEEAAQAQRMLDASNGDREEARKVLGWSRSRFDARLLLLHAHEDVLQALNERRIKLGIAELLSGLPKSAQEKNLPVVIEKGYSVSDLKQKIENMAQKLSTAIFNTAECATCPHNSSIQVSLFDDGLDEGQCMGRSCFAEKTKAALEDKRKELESQYNAVFLDVDKPAGSWVYLVESGNQGVGKKQYGICKGCSNYGALLSSEPGKEGEVTESVCFDPVCNTAMVKLAQKPKSTQKSKGDAPAGKSAASGSSGKKSSSRNTVAGTPKKVRDLAVSFLREEAARVAAEDPATRQSILLHALIHRIGKLNKNTGETLAQSILKLHDLDDNKLEQVEQRAVAYLLKEFKGDYGSSEQYEQAAFAVLKVTAQDLTGRFTLDQKFLEAHTKSGIEALMREACNPEGQSFADWWEAKRGPFKKLMAKKHPEIVKAILDTDFDFSQWVPSCITREVEKMKAQPANNGEKK